MPEQDQVRLHNREIAVLGGRFEEAARIISESWSENAEQTTDYNAQFLASCYEYPGVDPSLSPAILKDGKLAAFVCAFPRQVRFQGKTLRLALLTFFTVARGMKGNKLGISVWAECLTRARKAGYDGAIHYCVEGNRSNEITVAAAHSIGLETMRVFTVNYLMRFIKDSGPGCKEPDRQFHEAFAGHAAAIESVPLVRTWSGEEIVYECNHRYGAVCCAYRDDPGRGLLTGYVIPIADRARTRCLFIENLFWGALQPVERIELMEHLLRASDAQIAVVPLWGYADTSVFTAARFRRSTRVLHAYLTLWCGADRPSALNSMYIDVF
jgi:hypothetical protein